MGGGGGGGREGGEQGPGTGGTGPKKPLEQAAGPRPGEGMEGGGGGGEGAAVGGRSLFCIVHAPYWCLAGFLQDSQPAAAGLSWWGHAALTAVVCSWSTCSFGRHRAAIVTVFWGNASTFEGGDGPGQDPRS